MENKEKVLKVELDLSFPKLTWNIFSYKKVIVLKATIYKTDGCIIKLQCKKWCGLFFPFHSESFEILKKLILEYLNDYLESNDNGILSIKNHVGMVIINYPRFGYYIGRIRELIKSQYKRYKYNYDYDGCITLKKSIIDSYVFCDQ